MGAMMGMPEPPEGLPPTAKTGGEISGEEHGD